MIHELKKCPFCGGDVHNDNALSHTFICDNCDVIMKFPVKDKNLLKIIDDGMYAGTPQEFHQDAREQYNTRYTECCKCEAIYNIDDTCGSGCAYLYRLSCGHEHESFYDDDLYCPTCGKKIIYD